MPSSIRVSVVDHHAMVREGLAVMLNAHDRLCVVGTAASLDEFRACRDKWRPDVVVVDHDLPDGRGSELAVDARERDGAYSVLLLAGSEDYAVVDESVDSGCAGFLSKMASTSELADAIITIGNGATVFPMDALRQYSQRDDNGGFGLTNREMEVLEFLARAHPVHEIADIMSVSISTARNHVQAVLTKMNARSQLDAVVIGVRHRLVDIQPERTPALT